MAVCLAPITTSSRWKFVNQKWVRDRNKPCGKTAKGTLQDGTPACGVHLNAEKVRMRNAALKAVESSRLDEMAGEVGRSLRLSIHPLRFNPLDPNNVQGKPVAAATPPDAPQPQPPPAAPLEEYTVKAGDNLEKIAKAKYGSIRFKDLIFEANKDRLKSPDELRAGDRLRLPPKP